LKDRKGNELRPGDPAFIPIIVVKEDGGFVLCRHDYPDGTMGWYDFAARLDQVEKATPLRLAAADLPAALEALARMVIQAGAAYKASGRLGLPLALAQAVAMAEAVMADAEGRRAKEGGS
jgi:hypothetical protein